MVIVHSYVELPEGESPVNPIKQPFSPGFPMFFFRCQDVNYQRVPAEQNHPIPCCGVAMSKLTTCVTSLRSSPREQTWWPTRGSLVNTPSIHRHSSYLLRKQCLIYTWYIVYRYIYIYIYIYIHMYAYIYVIV